MASWILVPCLVSLRSEFNALAPDRSKASDGAVGDVAHSGSSSDHNPDETGRTPYEDADNVNEVHAIDVDKDLNRSGWTMDRAVQTIVTRHRAGLDDRLQNVIWKRRVWSASWNWEPRAYTGANAHTEHAHFSARYMPAQERDVSPWGLLPAPTPAPARPAPEQEELPVEQAQFDKLMTGWARSEDGRAALARAVLAYDPGKDAKGAVPAGGIPNPDGGSAASNPTIAATTALRDASAGRAEGRAAAAAVTSLAARVDTMDAKLDEIRAALRPTQEPEVVRAAARPGPQARA